MTGTALVFLVLACAEGLLLLAVSGLWWRGRHRQRVLRAKLAALRSPQSVPHERRLVPTGREAVKAVWETANLVRERGLGGAIRSSIDELAGWAQVEQPDLVRIAGPDGGMSILFSDIEGSTALNEQLGDKHWVRLLERHDRAVRKQVHRHGGHVIKTQGDGFMVVFTSPEQAVRCAIAVQKGFSRGERKWSTPVRVRIGIHHGDVVHRDHDIFGRNVAHAARVAALAEGGEVLVSDVIAEAVEEVEDLVLVDPRKVELKGFSGLHVVVAVDWRA